MEFNKDQVRAYKKMKKDFLFSIGGFSYDKERPLFKKMLENSNIVEGDIKALDDFIMKCYISLLSSRKDEKHEPMSTYQLLAKQSYRMGRRSEGFEYRKMYVDLSLIGLPKNPIFIMEVNLIAFCKCDHCASQNGKIFHQNEFDQLNDLPHVDCTGEVGCTCIYSVRPVRDENDRAVMNPDYQTQKTSIQKSRGCASIILIIILMSFFVAGISLN